MLWWNYWKCFQGSLGKAAQPLWQAEIAGECHSADRMRDRQVCNKCVWGEACFRRREEGRCCGVGTADRIVETDRQTNV